MIKLLINVRTDEKRIAILEEENLVELIIEQPGRQVFVGDIIKGKIVKVVPGLQAVFVDIGLEKTGYLHKNDLFSYNQLRENDKGSITVSELVTEGSEIIVQVEKESFGTKGPKLTELISLPGRKIVYLPNSPHVGVSKKIEENERERLRLLGEKICIKDEGLILRTSSVNMNETEMEEELKELRDKWTTILEKAMGSSCPSILYQEIGMVERAIRDFGMKDNIDEIIIDERSAYLQLKQLAETMYPSIKFKIQFYKEQQDLFSLFNVENEIEKSLQPKVWLKNGAFLVIERTEAMTVIDVNTGKFTGKQNQRETVIKTNEIAAVEIAKQIRLRNLSGMIIIDFISMSDPDALKRVEHTLQKELELDRNKVHSFGFTSLGLYQLTRKKMREPIEVELLSTCPCCNGKGMVYSAQTLLYKIERELLQHTNSSVEAVWLETSQKINDMLLADQERLLNQWKNKFSLEIFLSVHNEKDSHYTIRHLGDLSSVKDRYLQWVK